MPILGGMTRKRVLVVDDDVDVCRALARLLEDHADVSIAIGAEPALQRMVNHRADGTPYGIVIVDFNMVGPNGAWLLERVRTQFPECRRILVSGSPQDSLAVHLTPGLVDAFLDKPIEIEALIHAVTGP
jgi:DNA-binding NtrC family response regulator